MRITDNRTQRYNTYGRGFINVIVLSACEMIYPCKKKSVRLKNKWIFSEKVDRREIFGKFWIWRAEVVDGATNVARKR